MSLKEKKGSKLASLFSNGSPSPNSKKESSSSGEESERLLQEGQVDGAKKSRHLHKAFTRSKTTSSSSLENDYTSLKDAAIQSNDKLKRSGSVGKKVGSSLKSASKKYVLQIEVNLLTQLSEQNDRLITQARLIAILEDRANQQEARIGMLETVISNVQKEQQEQQRDDGGCLGNWLTSMFT